MNRNLMVVIILGLFIGLLLYMGNKKPSTDWRPNYSSEGYEPFDIDIAKNLLADHFDLQVIQDSSFTAYFDDQDEKLSYLYLGRLAHDSLMLEQIKTWIDQGHDAHLFIDMDNSNSFIYDYYETYQHYLLKLVQDISQDDENLETQWDYSTNIYLEQGEANAVLEFISPNRKLGFRYTSLPINKASDAVEVLGRFTDLEDNYPSEVVNYIKIKHGEGALFLHLAPLAFTNYALSEAENLDYFEAVFNHIQTEQVVFDQFNSEYRGLRNYLAKADNNTFQPDRKSSPLSYIFENPSLKFAWYLLIVGLLLFLIFQARRTQRAIPVLGKKKNRSLEFIEQSAHLYFKGRKHDQISKVQIALFYNFIKEKYQLSFSDFKKEHIEYTAKKIHIPIAYLERVRDIILYIERLDEVGQKDLIDLNRHLENFYHLSEKK